MRFRITDLLLFTVYFAVAAWLASTRYYPFSLIWLGVAVGFESGRRSDYPVWIMSFSGAILGTLVAFAVGGVLAIFMGYSQGVMGTMNTTKTFGAGMGAVLIGLDVVLWLTALMIVFWFIAAVKRGKDVGRTERSELRQASKMP